MSALNAIICFDVVMGAIAAPLAFVTWRRQRRRFKRLTDREKLLRYAQLHGIDPELIR